MGFIFIDSVSAPIKGRLGVVLSVRMSLWTCDSYKRLAIDHSVCHTKKRVAQKNENDRDYLNLEA